MDELMNLGELLKEGFQLVEGNLVGAVGEGFGGVGVGLDEDSVAAGGDSGAGEDRGEDAVATGAGALSAGALDGVGGVEDSAVAEFAHPVERSHIGHQVLIAKGGAAFSKKEILAADAEQFVGDVLDVPGGHELAFFDVDGPTGFAGGEDEVGLAGEEGGDLEEVDEFGGLLGFFGAVDVGCDGDADGAANVCEEGATFLAAEAAEAFAGGAVGFVVGGFEDPAEVVAVGDHLEAGGDVANEGFAFDDAGAEDEDGLRAVHDDGTDGDLRENGHVGWEMARYQGPGKGSGIDLLLQKIKGNTIFKRLILRGIRVKPV